MSTNLHALLEQEQRKLDLLKKLTTIDERWRREAEKAVSESGLDPTTLPFDLGRAGVVGVLLRDSSGPYVGLHIPDAARRYLQSLPNKTASTPEISHALLQGGIKSTAKNFTATVYTILSQKPQWFRRRGQTWTLIEEK